MSKYSVNVENCNSIENAEIKINIGQLNIKYGPNGLGKSTIAKAILAQVRNDGSLNSLIPFKYRDVDGSPPPSVSGIDDIKSILVFDDQYVNQFVFQQDEVVKNSFDIFVRTPEYEADMSEIELLFSGIKAAFLNNADIDNAIKDLALLKDAFGTSNKGNIAKSSKIHKAFGEGNKVEHIPEYLKPFEKFIQSEEPSKWISWQVKGNDFIEVADVCPYCSSDMVAPEKKEIALAVSKEYNAKSIEHLNLLKSLIERLGKYFSVDCRENLQNVVKTKIELKAEEKTFLNTLKSEIATLLEKLEALRQISFFSLRDVEGIEEKLSALKIDLKLIGKLNSPESQNLANPINEQLDALIAKVGHLKGKINTHKSRIQIAIKKNQDNINAFLKSAGYKYSVVIMPELESYKMKLIHTDLADHIASASNHLSYGEKNAFALVLFMHQVLSEKPDLAILDDPISSFDKNKKFAILHQLFHGKASLKERTILMLTHDIEPAIDVIKSVSGLFQAAKPSASFLFAQNGHVKEIEIEKNDIQTFAKICRDNIQSLTDDVIKSIYLRRHYEIIDDLGVEYNLLASLLHGRQSPTIQGNEGQADMSDEDKSLALTNIRNYIPSFNYESLLAEVTNEDEMKKRFNNTSVGYEKIQIFRIVRKKHDDDVITKFINESYHIENEYVMQLNPHKFDGVPEYVVNECALLINA